MFKAPLAETLRPKKLADLIFDHGQIQTFLNKGFLPSLLLYGPPGSGKTSLARILLNSLDLPKAEISAVSSSVKELRALGEKARELLKKQNLRFCLFVDEIHRFSRSQQDVLLPFIEEGSFLLIGATTENPSFEIIAPLLSRLTLIKFKPLGVSDLKNLYLRAKNLATISLELDNEALNALASLADGDARFFLNQLELLDNQFTNKVVSIELLKESLQKKLVSHDKDRDSHYDLISVLHKSVRSSDIQASLYWMARLIDSGEDKNFLWRRVIRMAIEDIGLAEPNLLNYTVNSFKAYQLLGSPEGDLLFYNTIILLASAPKSNASYLAEKNLKRCLKNNANLKVPLKFRNAVTKFMQKEGYAQGYQYDHDFAYHISKQVCLPEEILDQSFYEPGDLGYEKDIKKRMQFISKIKNET